MMLVSHTRMPVILSASFGYGSTDTEIQSSREGACPERSEGMTGLTPLKPAHRKP